MLEDKAIERREPMNIMFRGRTFSCNFKMIRCNHRELVDLKKGSNGKDIMILGIPDTSAAERRLEYYYLNARYRHHMKGVGQSKCK